MGIYIVFLFIIYVVVLTTTALFHFYCKGRWALLKYAPLAVCVVLATYNFVNASILDKADGGLALARAGYLFMGVSYAVGAAFGMLLLTFLKKYWDKMKAAFRQMGGH
ncbi:MAG: hypothetical protein FWE70_05180 [Oscillospiraceae bacterium]|nr:hypothetical protein [Oscillospiraceae bacterium]